MVRKWRALMAHIILDDQESAALMRRARMAVRDIIAKYPEPVVFFGGANEDIIEILSETLDHPSMTLVRLTSMTSMFIKTSGEGWDFPGVEQDTLSEVITFIDG